MDRYRASKEHIDTQSSKTNNTQSQFPKQYTDTQSPNNTDTQSSNNTQIHSPHTSKYIEKTKVVREL